MSLDAELSNHLDEMNCDERDILSMPEIGLYHISLDSSLPPRLEPRLAEAFIEDSDDYFAEPGLPHISFSDSLEGCVRGVYQNPAVTGDDIATMFNKHGVAGVKFTVYKLVSGKRFINPESLNKRSIYDALVTREWWSLDSVKIVPVFKIIVKADVEKDWLVYKPYGVGEERYHSPKELDITIIEH